MCAVAVTAGHQVLIIAHPGRLAARDPLIHTSVQVSVWCRAFLPPVRVTTTCSGCSSPSGCHRLSESSREASYHTPGQIILMGLMSWAAILQHYVKISRSPCSILFFFSQSAQGLREREAYKVETETCLFTMLWVSICLVRKKREKKQ